MTTIAIQKPEKSTYGAVELKEFIKKNTLKSFIYTAIGFLLLLLIYFGLSEITDKGDRKFHQPPISSLTLIPPAPIEESEEETEEPPAPPEEVIIGIQARAGIPVPVPAAELDEDLAEFADLDNMEDATDIAADSIGDIEEFTLDEPDVEVTEVADVKVEELPDRNEFIPVEVEAQTDMAALQKLIEYPEMAKRANIEGVVHISIWIDKDGKPKKPKVIKSASSYLNEAAIKACMKAVWTPAVQNDRTVGMWVTVPIRFKLSD